MVLLILLRDPKPRREKIKLIYHPTPWRGLSVLLGAMQVSKQSKHCIRCL